MVGEFALEFGEFAMLFVFDEPDVVLQPESKEEAFEVGRADPGPGGVIVRIVGSLVGDFFFVVHIKGVTGGNDRLALVSAEIQIPEDTPLLVVEESEQHAAVIHFNEVFGRVEIAGGAGRDAAAKFA